MELTISFFIIRPCLLLQYFDQMMKACEGEDEPDTLKLRCRSRLGAVRCVFGPCQWRRCTAGAQPYPRLRLWGSNFSPFPSFTHQNVLGRTVAPVQP